MCELKSCLGNEGVSDVQFTGEDGGGDMADSRIHWDGGDRVSVDRGAWCKRCSRLEGDGFSPEALFLGGERWRLTVVTVGPRLASRTTASSEVEEWSSLDLELFRDWGLDLGWSGAGISLGSDRFEARCRCLVLGLWSSAEEAEFALGAIMTSRGIGCRFGRV